MIEIFLVFRVFVFYNSGLFIAKYCNLVFLMSLSRESSIFYSAVMLNGYGERSATTSTLDSCNYYKDPSTDSGERLFTGGEPRPSLVNGGLNLLSGF